MAKILEIPDLGAMLGQLGMYFMTVMLGLFLHGFGTIALMFFLVVRKLPYGYLAQMSQVLATAFGTGSSSATMPITIQCLDRMGIDPRVTRFVIPVGATINMDGTALYEAVAALFIAQLRRVPLTFGKIVAVRWETSDLRQRIGELNKCFSILVSRQLLLQSVLLVFLRPV